MYENVSEFLTWMAALTHTDNWVVSAILGGLGTWLAKLTVVGGLRRATGAHLEIREACQQLLKLLENPDGWTGCGWSISGHNVRICLDKKDREIKIRCNDADKYFNRRELRHIYAAAEDVRDELRAREYKTDHAVTMAALKEAVAVAST